MQVVTFYSYKGGVGRTLACANFGLYLAKTGQKVALADMDLEAPGLDSKFPSLSPEDCSAGMIDQFYAFQSETPLPDIGAVEIPLPDDVAAAGGSLRLIPAGNYASPDYYPKLAGLDWDLFLRQEQGLAFCVELVKRIEQQYGADVLVIDSRTGLTEVGGLCTQVLPDTVIMLTCTSRESMAGTRRIHERIRTSPIVRKRSGERTSVEIRVVVTRTPRPENLADFDAGMKERLALELDRLYYLFEERELSIDEFLALDRFADEHPAILDDYVELFSSFSPEFTHPYIQKRLDSFRAGITKRSRYENERLIQELVTLFPQPEALLEAAGYYRIAEGGATQAVANYLRYLEQRPDDAEAVAQFAEVCASVPENELRPPELVARYLRVLGQEKMVPELLSRYFRLCEGSQAWPGMVRSVAEDDPRLRSDVFRRTFFRALRDLGEWERIVSMATEGDCRPRGLGLIVAEAHAALDNVQEAHRILSGYEMLDPGQAVPVLRVFFKTMPEADLDQVLRVLNMEDEHRFFMILKYSEHLLAESKEGESGFREWLSELRRQAKGRQ